MSCKQIWVNLAAQEGKLHSSNIETAACRVCGEEFTIFINCSVWARTVGGMSSNSARLHQIPPLLYPGSDSYPQM